MTACAYTASNPQLAALATRLCERVGYCGIADLDFRYDRRDGRYKLVDFNPRTGAQFRLFENAAGVDVVRALHLDLTGRPVPQASCARAQAHPRGERRPDRPAGSPADQAAQWLPRPGAVRAGADRARLAGRRRPAARRVDAGPVRGPARELLAAGQTDPRPAAGNGGHAPGRRRRTCGASQTGAGTRSARDEPLWPLSVTVKEGRYTMPAITSSAPAVVIGAGPYGLSVAAHLRGRGIAVRTFGDVMDGWHTHMPAGMFLKSTSSASSLSAPGTGSTLADFCVVSGTPAAGRGRRGAHRPVRPLRPVVRRAERARRGGHPDPPARAARAAQPGHPGVGGADLHPGRRDRHRHGRLRAPARIAGPDRAGSGRPRTAPCRTRGSTRRWPVSPAGKSR